MSYAYVCPANDGPDAFTAWECFSLLDVATTKPARPGTVRQAGDIDPQIRTVTVHDVTEDEAPEYYRKLMWLAGSVNRHWWGFDLTHLSNVEVLHYAPGGHYTEHVDLFPGFETRKLTAITFLSHPEDYGDGALVLRTSAGLQRLRPHLGTTLFFPSWVPHWVEPVTAGERWVATAWIEGPRFR